MQSRQHEHCKQSCIGPPAPKNGAIRMTKRNGTQQFLDRSRTAAAGTGFFASIDTTIAHEDPCTLMISKPQ